MAEASPTFPDDTALIQRCLGGDTQSFQVLYRRYQSRVRGTLYRLCGPTHLDDLVQDVFLRVWRGLPRLRQPQLFGVWLYRIALNVAADHRHQAGLQRDQQRTLAAQGHHHTDPLDLNHCHYQDLVERGIRQLPFEQRAVLILHDLEDRPQKEIAEILKIPVGTVKSRLFRARAALRQFFADEGVHL
ncbi:MAG: sigma-70 family RNA polymerase sigma factor [Gloeomargaritaceae cyanobacterium C42_A2020_066]|nr:sigma-70 family RNA polymerase sigma factor [Gloeomargaritaceae cyanobacterium C42_A2020_066]